MTVLEAYRDDGPLARLVGRAFAKVVRLDELLLTLGGAVLLGALLAAPDRTRPGDAAVAAAVFVMLAAARSRGDEVGALTWLVPPLLRGIEFSYLIALTAIADFGALPLCFAFVSVIALHHYDTVYRLRHQRLAPPAWIAAIGGGWDGRMLLASLFALVGVLDVALLVASVGLALVYAVESTASWLRYGRSRHAPDEEQLEVDGMLAE
jgi:hypothetical protein